MPKRLEKQQGRKTGDFDVYDDYGTLKPADIAPENVQPGTRRGRIRMVDKPAGDPMSMDPEEQGGYYDRKLFPKPYTRSQET